MIERIKMECYEKQYKLECLDLETPLKEETKTRISVEETGISKKKALIKVKACAKQIYQKSEGQRKAIVHYAECCIQFPNEEDLQSAKQLSMAMKHRFRLVGADTLFDENDLSQKKQSDGSYLTTYTKYTQTDAFCDDKTWWLEELKGKRDRLKIYQSKLLKDYNKVTEDINMLDFEIESKENKSHI
ncbi:unnamed protein product [Mytilus edulis]|uniref:Uncharacterized protein n=1 Tax=Mytilus edulis TaxID=6550 RepID=A0A8S3UUX3_MYTED|nr:unnamed protein product [Mytilus edulis]